jgi:hypothetical protein
MDIPHEKQFHFRDGTAIASLEQLKAKIESVSYQEFYHHVNTQKNDFASWVRYVLHDERLADDLQKVTSIVETVEIINDHLHPRPVEMPRIDVQSKIELDVLKSLGNDMTDDGMAIEQVPTVAPSPARTGEFTELPVIEEKAQEELFGKPVAPHMTPSAPQPTRVEHAEDLSQFIVKDFMYGLVFGLIVGLVLGLMISV